MARFIGRYAASEAPKYPVARVEWSNQSVRGAPGLMVDSRVVLADGSSYDVRWLLFKYGNSYKVRDAMVLGFWMTPFLKNLFEDYISKNGGNPRALQLPRPLSRMSRLERRRLPSHAPRTAAGNRAAASCRAPHRQGPSPITRLNERRLLQVDGMPRARQQRPDAPPASAASSTDRLVADQQQHRFAL